MPPTKTDQLTMTHSTLAILLGELAGILNSLERGTGAREVALSITRLQESMFWLHEALEIVQKEEDKNV